ncbi:uncharacterized protein F4812DRAFT_425197 [Daldinia caldariorum]|uniref:uncharacterized protein n=1 Tax=Daldinia caldariorum TaxID=326644 RepID=UPI0020083ECE|nr:uncharacterized protein F4812DRAFT_425197 [Daldinia caldariorum]KAI1468920.1 hypothetical protein F4812DRAFT_425197 [Daldinia caldariorum]
MSSGVRLLRCCVNWRAGLGLVVARSRSILRKYVLVIPLLLLFSRSTSGTVDAGLSLSLFFFWVNVNRYLL